MKDTSQQDSIERCRRYGVPVCVLLIIACGALYADNTFMKCCNPLFLLFGAVVHFITMMTYILSTKIIFCEVAFWGQRTVFTIFSLVSSHFMMEIEELGCGAVQLIWGAFSYPLGSIFSITVGFKTSYWIVVVGFLMYYISWIVLMLYHAEKCMVSLASVTSGTEHAVYSAKVIAVFTSMFVTIVTWGASRGAIHERLAAVKRKLKAAWCACMTMNGVVESSSSKEGDLELSAPIEPIMPAPAGRFLPHGSLGICHTIPEVDGSASTSTDSVVTENDMVSKSSVEAVSSDEPISRQSCTALQVASAGANRLQVFEGGMPVAGCEVDSENSSPAASIPSERSSSLKL